MAMFDVKCRWRYITKIGKLAKEKNKSHAKYSCVEKKKEEEWTLVLKI